MDRFKIYPLNASFSTKEKESPLGQDVLLLEETDQTHHIVVHNDDFNTFDYVIDCLIEICEHTPIQAEQCTYLIHHKGKCEVKTGSLEELKPKHRALLSRGLSSELT
ncbi:MAG: Clp protease ClpS [Flavobacteriaceae bacterium]|nr:MAG: Clp protease ClpS [Flavobacteriaceae bacterium]